MFQFLGGIFFYDNSLANEQNWVLDSTAARWPNTALPKLNVHINVHAFNMTTSLLFMSCGGNGVCRTALTIRAI